MKSRKEIDGDYYLRNREKRLSYAREYRKRNKGLIRENMRLYRIKNRAVLREKAKIRHQKRILADISYRVSVNVRARLNNYLKFYGINKDNKTFDYIGCSKEELKKHLESKFKPGMNWDNYGINGWHIDHIKPLCIFNLEDESELRTASHYTNLQPLWAKENLMKNGKY